MSDSRPMTEMSPWSDTIGTRPFLHGLWLSDRNEPPETVNAEITLTKAKGASAVLLHCDDGSAIQRSNTLLAAILVRNAGLVPIYSIHVNHGISLDRWPDDCERGFVVNIRTFGKDKATLLAGVVWAVEKIQGGEITACYVLGWEHCDWPELKAWLTAVLNLAQRPSVFPGAPAVPTKPPILPVDHKPPKPVEQPDKSDKAQAITASVLAAIPGIVWLVKWLNRRKR